MIRNILNKFILIHKKPIELYTAYKNKYPKMSNSKYSIENRQREAGRCIKNIKADDNNYRKGLQALEENIKIKTKEMGKIKDINI